MAAQLLLLSNPPLGVSADRPLYTVPAQCLTESFTLCPALRVFKQEWCELYYDILVKTTTPKIYFWVILFIKNYYRISFIRVWGHITVSRLS